MVRVTRRKPNFFIIGAPKCGTTSLAAWLAGHPQVFMSPIKEPRFFDTDHSSPKITCTQDYCRLFKNVHEMHRAIGEASPSYLYSKHAVPNIEDQMEDAKYIALLRNPVEMAVSLHQQQIVSGNEHVRDFKKAWALSAERGQGEHITWLTATPELMNYKSVCKLGEQIQRLFTYIDKQRVLILFLDDIMKSPQREYNKTLQFLGLMPDSRKGFPVYNSAKARRWPLIHKGFKLMNRVTWKLNIPSFGIGLGSLANRINSVSIAQPCVDDDVYETLLRHFMEDIETLEKVTGRNLEDWRVQGDNYTGHDNL